MSAEMKNCVTEFEGANSREKYPCDFGPSLYVVIPFCVLISTFLCTGGWRSGLRATLLGAGLLLGILLTKRFCSSDAGIWRRLAYFITAGILGGLVSALVIWSLELLIGSPTLQDNPYNQDGLNLFWICPLYGIFVLGFYALAFNLSRMARYFIVVCGAALANTFCTIDVAYNPDLVIFIRGMLKNCVVYYIPCLGNSLFYVFLFNMCADGIYRKLMRITGVSTKILTVVMLVIVGYFGFMFFGLLATGIKLERFMAQNKNTAFKEKLTGLLVIPRMDEYYDCEKKEIFKMPKNFEVNDSYYKTKKNLRIDDNKGLKIEVLKDGKVTKRISRFRDYENAVIVNKNVYYKSNECLFRLSPPNYDKPELLLKNFRSYRFVISPDEKFVTRYDLIHGELGRMVLCITNLKSKKNLAVKKMMFFSHEIFWVNDLNEIRIKHESKKKK